MGAGGLPLPNRTISLRLSLLDSASASQSVYTETQTTITDTAGLFTVIVGAGIPAAGAFSRINRAHNKKWLRTEIDTTGGSNYLLLGVTEFMGAPFALYAGSNAAYTIKLNGVPISHPSLNLVVVGESGSLNSATFTFLTSGNYLLTLYNGTNDSTSYNNPAEAFTTDTLAYSNTYINVNPALSLNADNFAAQFMYFNTQGGPHGFYYVPVNATMVHLAHAYLNSEGFYDQGPGNYIQVFPNNPAVTGFNPVLPIKVTVER